MRHIVSKSIDKLSFTYFHFFILSTLWPTVISGVESDVLLKLVRYYEMSLLQSRENKQFCLTCLSIAKSMSDPRLFTEISIARLVAEQLTSF